MKLTVQLEECHKAIYALPLSKVKRLVDDIKLQLVMSNHHTRQQKNVCITTYTNCQ